MTFHDPAVPDKPAGFLFPSLPIVTPDPPKRSQVEKYGSLYVLSLAGLFVVVGLVGWFGYSSWSLRDVWANVYVLHNERRSDAERVEAAYALSRDPRVNQRERWDICLRKPLPGLARYVLAESLTAEAISGDPRGYGLTVAKSTGWPNWLRLLLMRPLAYAAGLGQSVPREPLEELSKHDDPAIALWATYALAAGRAGDASAASRLEQAADRDGPNRELAYWLLASLRARGSQRIPPLDQATRWLRTHHAESARLWKGWQVRGNRLVPVPAPKLH